MNKIVSLPPLALIAGPTASGKSALALALAERTGGIIINADSTQVYGNLRILSARPTRQEEARVPHRLFGTRDGATACSAADWAQAATHEIAAAHSASRLPILVGGTGLYLRTVLEGIAPVPEIDPEVREIVRLLDTNEAFDRLREEDPAAAARLHSTDTTRISRALEVVRSTGHTLADWQQQRTGGIGDQVALRPLILLPPREWLYARCDARFEDMLGNDEGIAEVAALLVRGLAPALPVMRAIGVREIAALLDGRMTRAEAIAAGRQATRNYAKRQYTWFRRQPPAEWPRFTEPLDCDRIGDALATLA